ncbi:MAG: 3-deoxy-7-phosphoheptulonate synthase [Burkholderiaceae bacterium]
MAAHSTQDSNTRSGGVLAPVNTTLDTTRIDDLRIKAVRPLISPAILHEEHPVPPASQALIESARRDIASILHGQSERLVVVVGPCSVHDYDQAIDYGQRLAGLMPQVEDALLIVMRVYFEKPRTTVGWKGFINDPQLDGSFRINQGLRQARRLLLDLAALGVPAGTEFLDMLSPQYIADLVAWGAIGARTTESQSHRQLASGLSCPIGFKNGTEGSVRVATDAIVAAGASHAFIGMTKMGQAAVFETRGNQDCHLILRGGRQPNYDRASIESAWTEMVRSGLSNRLMVDCSHANSAKQHQKQLEVLADLGAQLAEGERRLGGVMIESHLNPGRQDLAARDALEYGVSITDACIGWQDTEAALHSLAQAVRNGT